MMEFLFIVMLVFGILQIILFFKIWGMTNDVKEIVKKMSFPYNKNESSMSEYYSKFLFLLYFEGKSQAKEYLYKVMWNNGWMIAMVNCKTHKKFDEYHKCLRDEYQSWFEKLGEEFPSFDNIKNDKNE